MAHSNVFHLCVAHIYYSGETLKDVVSARFAPAMLEPEPDYPPRIVAVLSAVRASTNEVERRLVRSHSFILCTM